jgi:Bacterial Ig domain
MRRRYDAAMRAASRLSRRRIALLLCAALAGCGGGVFIGYEFGGPGDRAPAVALTASATEAVPGAIVRLAAAASDDFGIDHVDFLRRDGAGNDTLLAADRTEPYQTDVTIPPSPAGTVVRYVARAVDVAGQSTTSAPVDVTVR